jgi:tRNA-guanine family transglycosylase
LGTQVIISNAFVLYLRPGLETVTKAGGLHKFMKWSGSIFTDSGGFQIIRKDFKAKVKDEGILFQDPYDGAKHELTPEMKLPLNVRSNGRRDAKVIMMLKMTVTKTCSELSKVGYILTWQKSASRPWKNSSSSGTVSAVYLLVNLKCRCTKL